MADPDVDVIRTEDVVAVRLTVHPPIEGVLGGGLPANVKVLPPPGGIRAMGDDPVVVAGAVGARVRILPVADHVDAVFAGGLA